MLGTADDLDERDLEFRYLSGSVALALTATVGERWSRNFERLRDPDDLGRWLFQAGLTSRPTRVSTHELEEARKLRAAIYRTATALIAGTALKRADIARMNLRARTPPPAPQLDRLRIRWVAEATIPGALSLIARDAVTLFGGPLAGRIRECESPECALLFVDASRPGQRRWCSSETCGSRARSAAYRSRQ